MAYSYQDTTLSGTNNNVFIPFAFGSRDDITVRTGAPGSYVYYSGNQLSWTSDSLVSISGALKPAGTPVRVLRSTSKTSIPHLSSGNLDPSTLNTAMQQLLYVLQETYDAIVEDPNVSIPNSVLASVTTLVNTATQKAQVATDKATEVAGIATALSTQLAALAAMSTGVVNKADTNSATLSTVLRVQHETSGTPAVGIGTKITLEVEGLGGLREYAALDVTSLDVTGATEDGVLNLSTIVAGTLSTKLSVGQGVWTVGATGGDKGAGTFNAQGYFKNGKPLVDKTADVTTAPLGAWVDVTHGLGVIPSLITEFWKCTATDNGYAIGDVVSVGRGSTGSSMVIAKTDKLTVRIVSMPSIPNLSTGTVTALTGGKWSVYYGVAA